MNNARAGVILAMCISFGVLVYLLAPILAPFFVAVLLAYLFNPVVARLTRMRLPRTVAVLLVFVLLAALLLALVLFLAPLVQQQIIKFAQNVPAYLDHVQREWVPWIEGILGRPLATDVDSLRAGVIANWESIADVARRALTNVASSGARVVSWLIAVALIPVVMFYFLLDWERLWPRVLELFPPSVRPTLRTLAQRTDEALGSFLRGQLLVMTCLAFVYSLGLWIIGLDLALPIGMLAGLASFVPYLGFVIGIVTAGVAAYLQFHDVLMLGGVAAVFLVGQVLEGYVLTPRFVGSAIGLHPVAIIFSVMAGGQLFGFVGVLLALPAAAALKVWLGWLHDSYVTNESSPPSPRRSARTKP